jgi:hypothetical protein
LSLFQNPVGFETGSMNKAHSGLFSLDVEDHTRAKIKNTIAATIDPMIKTIFIFSPLSVPQRQQSVAQLTQIITFACRLNSHQSNSFTMPPHAAARSFPRGFSCTSYASSSEGR